MTQECSKQKKSVDEATVFFRIPTGWELEEGEAEETVAYPKPACACLCKCAQAKQPSYLRFEFHLFEG